MAQNRKPPAYQEYAASVIASADYRMLTLTARGLLYTLKLECWENRQVPREPTALSRFLGVSEEELRSTLPQVMFYFQIEGRFLICPEIEDYRQHLADTRAKQVAGGKKGAARANERRLQMTQAATGNTLEVSQGSTTGSLDKLSPDKSNSNSVINKEVSDEHKQWLDDFDSTEPHT